MEKVLSKACKFLMTIFAVYAPFLVLGAAIVLMPSAFQAMKSLSGMDWIWLITLGAMTLGMFYMVIYLKQDAEAMDIFTQIDANHDGYISREEARRYKGLSRVFDQMDADHDGRLSREEFVHALAVCK